MKTSVQSPDSPAAIGPYSQGVLADGLLFVSGQLPIDPATGEFAGETAAAQAEQCLKNLAAVLAAGGATPDDVIRTTIYLKDMNDFAAVNEVYGSVFSAPHPARACVEVARLPKDAKVEIECVAALPPSTAEQETAPVANDTGGKTWRTLCWVLGGVLFLVRVFSIMLLLVLAAHLSWSYRLPYANQMPEPTPAPTRPGWETVSEDDFPHPPTMRAGEKDGSPVMYITVEMLPGESVTFYFPSGETFFFTTTETDNIAYDFPFYYEYFYPDAPLDESVYMVYSCLAISDDTGIVREFDLDPFTLTFSPVALELEYPSVEELLNGVMANEENSILLRGLVSSDPWVRVTVNGQPMEVYAGGVFQGEYKLTIAEGAETLVIRAEKDNYVTAELLIFVHAYIP